MAINILIIIARIQMNILLHSQNYIQFFYSTACSFKVYSVKKSIYCSSKPFSTKLDLPAISYRKPAFPNIVTRNNGFSLRWAVWKHDIYFQKCNYYRNYSYAKNNCFLLLEFKKSFGSVCNVFFKEDRSDCITFWKGYAYERMIL